MMFWWICMIGELVRLVQIRQKIKIKNKVKIKSRSKQKARLKSGNRLGISDVNNEINKQ